jgi:hypothetical protein
MNTSKHNFDENPSSFRRGGFVAPRTPAEELLAVIWGAALDLDEVGLYDDLVELGAGELAATQVSVYLCGIFQVNLSAGQLLRPATLDDHVSLLSQTWGGRDVVEEIAWTFLQIQQLSDQEVEEKLIAEAEALRGKQAFSIER